MHYGFYEELDSLLEEDNDADWGFLENIGHEYDLYEESLGFDGIKREYIINAYNFLHGYCNEFAYMLNEKYGYPVFEIKDEKGKLVHSFTRLVKDNVYYFIDIRGITTDYHEFISEFEDWIDEETSIENTFLVDLSKEEVRKEQQPSKVNRQFIEELFSDYGDYYNSLSQYFKEQNDEIER